MTETDKNTLPQELREWIEEDAEKKIPLIEYKKNENEIFYDITYYQIKDNIERERRLIIDGATALYAHLKPLIDKWKATAEGNEIIAIARGNAINDLQNLLDAKDEEIGLLKTALSDILQELK